MKAKNNLSLITQIYICVILVYSFLREVIPLTDIVGSEILSYGCFLIGLLLILANIIISKSVGAVLRNNYWIAFWGVCAVSTLINYKYALVSNIKALGWMCIYFFLIYVYGRKGNSERALKVFSWISLLVSCVTALLSVPMYYFGVDYTSINDKMIGSVSNQGFSSEFLRLWGIFADPNTASMYMLVSMTMGIWLFIKCKRLLLKIIVIICECISLIYVVLAGSRTAMLSIMLAVGILGTYVGIRKLNEKKNNFIISALIGILCVILALAALTGLKRVIPLTKSIISTTTASNISSHIHGFYDGIYQSSGVEITAGYQEAATAPDPDAVGEAVPEEPEQSNPETEVAVIPSAEEIVVEENLERDDWSEKADVSNGRFSIWMDAIEIFTYSPVIGASPRGACFFGRSHCPDNDISQFGYAAHNTWLEVLMCTGLLGLLVAVIILAVSFCKCVKVFYYRDIDIDIIIPIVIIAELLCSSLLLSDLFFIFSFGGIVFWYFLGVVDGQLESRREKKLENLNRQRVLIYGPKDPPGGVEKIVHDYVAEITAKHENIGFDFVEYGSNFSMEEELVGLGCRVIYLPSRKKNYLAYKRAIKKVFEDTPYLAVWGNYSGLTNIDLMTYGKKYGVPKRIAHSHGTRFYWGSPLMKYVVYILHYYNSMRIRKYVTDFWACSDMAGKFMFPASVQGNIKIVHNAVSMDCFKYDEGERAEVRKELGITSNAFIVGHVARMCEVKNQGFLLKIMKEVHEIDPKAKLLFVGTGELNEYLHKLSAELGLEQAVIYLGERSDVPRLLSAMDAFVLCSLAEGLSLSAVEAQAAGVPCVLPTSVSSETDISSLVQFLSLEESPRRWAKTILNCNRNSDTDFRSKIKNSGYDLSSAAEELYSRFMLH